MFYIVNNSKEHVVDAVAELRRARQAVQPDGPAARKPSVYEFRAAYERGLEASGYTGEVVGITHYNQGVLTKWRPLKEDKQAAK